MAAAAAARRLSSHFFSPPPPFSLLKRLPLSPESPLISASQNPVILRVLAGLVRYGTSSCSVFTEGDSDAGRVQSVPVRVAHELLQSGHRYLDVRTPEEFSSGHAVGAANIPYMFQAASGMTKNPKFLEEVSSTFEKDDEIIVGCRSGKRSLKAASDLLAAGFTGVTDIAGGYLEWVQNGLPSE